MRSAKAWSLGLLISLTAFCASAEVIRLGIGTSSGTSYPPYMVLESDQKTYSGLVYEILNDILAVTGDTVQPVYLPAPRIFSGISNGDIDLDIFSNPEWRREFAQDSIYTVPYLSTRNYLVYRRDYPGILKDIEDLKGKTLLLTLGFHYTEVDSLVADGTIKRENAPSTAQLLKMLDARHGEIRIVDGAVFYELARKNRLTSLTLGFPTTSPTEVRMRFPKRMASMVTRFNAAIELLRKNGTLKRLLAKYRISQ